MKLEDVKKPILYKPEQVCKFMDISKFTLWRMIAAGLISAVNLCPQGKKPIYRITAESVQHYYDTIFDSDKSPKKINK